MTTREQIMMTLNQAEMSAILGDMCDALRISPPCSVTKTYFAVRITGVVCKNAVIAEAAERLKQAQMDFLRLP